MIGLKVTLQGMRWTVTDEEVCWHRRKLRRAVMRGLVQSLIWIHGNFDLANRAA